MRIKCVGVHDCLAAGQSQKSLESLLTPSVIREEEELSSQCIQGGGGAREQENLSVSPVASVTVSLVAFSFVICGRFYLQENFHCSHPQRVWKSKALAWQMK